jgi:hypothetical protein
MCRNLLNEETAGFWTDAQLNAYLEMGNQRLNSIIAATRQDYNTISAVFATVVGTKSYSFPTDCVFIRRLEIYDTTNADHIDKVDELRFPRTEANGDWPFSGPGQPQRYIIRGKQFDLLPIPDAIYNMRIYYDARPATLSADVDAPTSPPDFHDMIVFYACMLAKKQNEVDDAGFADMFRTRKQELVQLLIRRGGEDPTFVESYLEGVI